MNWSLMNWLLSLSRSSAWSISSSQHLTQHTDKFTAKNDKLFHFSRQAQNAHVQSFPPSSSSYSLSLLLLILLLALAPPPLPITSRPYSSYSYYLSPLLLLLFITSRPYSSSYHLNLSPPPIPSRSQLVLRPSSSFYSVAPFTSFHTLVPLFFMPLGLPPPPPGLPKLPYPSTGTFNQPPVYFSPVGTHLDTSSPTNSL